MIGGDLLKPFNSGGHAAYQERVLTQLRKYYPDAASSLPSSTWDIMKKFWTLDLSEVDTILCDRYSDFGPAPRLPSDMLRSLLLSVEVKITSYTKWAHNLKENHLYAILSGFTVGNTPGNGVPVCREGHTMRRDGTESAKARTKFKCPKISFAGGNVTCTCENPCSDAKYGRTVHLVMKDNPRLFNDPPRSSKEWREEYSARTSAERCNKREKIDYKSYLKDLFEQAA